MSEYHLKLRSQTFGPDENGWGGMMARLDLSLTDEPPLAQAIVIISALPAAVRPGDGG